MRTLRTILIAATLVLSAIGPVQADLLEFDRSDLYPKFVTIDFGKNAVYFSGSKLGDKALLWYVLDRRTNSFERLKSAPDRQHIPGLVITPMAFGGAPIGAYLGATVETGKHVSFGVHIPYCGEGAEDDGELDDANGNKLPVPLKHCAAPGAIEQYGPYLLIGSMYFGEGGLSATKPVIVVNAKTYKLVKKIPVAATAIRADPYADQVWMAGENGIVLLDRNLNIKKRWYFHIGFHPGNHRPALLLSEQHVEDEPMADLARVIGVHDMDAWFKVVQSIPAKQREKFELYDLHMSNFQKLPADFNVLFPIFVKTIRESTDDMQRYYAIKTLCGMTDPGVIPFLKKLKRSSGLDRSVIESVNECLRDRNNAWN